jgi:hypothetical protein
LCHFHAWVSILTDGSRLAVSNQALETTVCRTQYENAHLKEQLQREKDLRRAGTKAELQAKRKLEYVTGLYYIQEALNDELEDNARKTFRRLTTEYNTNQQAMVRRLDGFSNMVTLCHVMWSNINQNSKSELAHIYDLAHDTEALAVQSHSIEKQYVIFHRPGGLEYGQ